MSPSKFAALGLLLALHVPAAGKIYAVDPVRSSVTFTARLAGRSVPGLFSKFSGTVGFDPAHPGFAADAVVDAASLSTNNGSRDRHLRSADYFDCEHFPEITFHGGSVSSGASGDFDLIGRLTIKGATQKVTIHVHPVGGAGSLHWEAKAEVNRKDYGIAHDSFADLAIGDTVEIALNIQTSAPPADKADPAPGNRHDVR